MQFQHLRTFTQAVRSGSLSEAAEVLYITQPAVSQHIRALEKHFNTQLLHRTNRGVAPTAAGEIVFAYANRILDLTEKLEQEMQALESSVSGELVVGASSTVGGYAVPCSICIFKERVPEATFKLRVANRRTVLDWLRHGEVHVALVEGEPFEGPFTCLTITTDELSLICSPHDSPWNGRSMISISDLVEAPMIMREPGSATRQTIERALAAAGLSIDDLNVILELNHVDSIKAAVEAGRGVSVVSNMAIRKELRTGTLMTVKVSGIEFRQKVFLAWQRDRLQNRLEKLFVRFLRSPDRGFC